MQMHLQRRCSLGGGTARCHEPTTSRSSHPNWCVDRVLECGRLLRLDGPSVRTLHVNLDDAMKEESDQQADLVRMSEKNWSEFPEPTDVDLQRQKFHVVYRFEFGNVPKPPIERVIVKRLKNRLFLSSQRNPPVAT
jgi:hypothetical protein